MSDAAAHRRTVAARLVRRFPSLLGSIERGEVHLSTLVLLRDHLTAENVDELIGAVAGKSTREVQELLARRAPRPDVPATLQRLPTPTELPLAPAPTTPPAPRPPPPPARIEPIAEERYVLQLTASRELRDKLERARDLMMHANATGDLAVVVERALDALLEKLEKTRLGNTKRPRQAMEGTKPGYIARAVRREVFARDGEQCTYSSADGERCAERKWLELDHVVAKARGGTDDAANLRVRCRSHNRLHAEETYGKAHVEARIELRHRKWDAEAADLARRGLVHLGFKEREAKRALDLVSERHANDATPPPKEILLREALSALAK